VLLELVERVGLELDEFLLPEWVLVYPQHAVDLLDGLGVVLPLRGAEALDVAELLGVPLRIGLGRGAWASSRQGHSSSTIRPSRRRTVVHSVTSMGRRGRRRQPRVIMGLAGIRLQQARQWEVSAPVRAGSVADVTANQAVPRHRLGNLCHLLRRHGRARLLRVLEVQRHLIDPLGEQPHHHAVDGLMWLKA